MNRPSPSGPVELPPHRPRACGRRDRNTLPALGAVVGRGLDAQVGTPAWGRACQPRHHEVAGRAAAARRGDAAAGSAARLPGPVRGPERVREAFHQAARRRPARRAARGPAGRRPGRLEATSPGGRGQTAVAARRDEPRAPAGLRPRGDLSGVRTGPVTDQPARWHIAGSAAEQERTMPPVFYEPMVCPACLPYALAVCPALRHGNRREKVSVYRLLEWEYRPHCALIGPSAGERTERCCRGRRREPGPCTPTVASSCRRSWWSTS